MQRLLGGGLLVLCFISLITLIFHRSFSRNSDQKNAIASQSSSLTNTAIKIAVIEFYSSYTSCLKDNPDGNQNYCQKQNTFLSKNFIHQVKDNSQDLLTCSQALPVSIEVSDVTRVGSKTEADITETFPASLQKVQLTLVQENKIWKVQTITCLSS